MPSSSRPARTARLLATGLVTAGLTVPLTLTAGAAHAAPAAGSPAACPTTKNCRVVARTDIDGDGRADTVSLTSSAKNTAQTLRVVTARGAVAQARYATPHLTGEAFHGTTPMDGVRGSEIVVRTGDGAHTSRFSVYTWRKGALVAQKDPTGSTTWTTDGALSASIGYTRRTVKGTPQLTHVALTRDGWGGKATLSGTRTVARWEKGHWRPITVRNVVVPDTPAAWSTAGWNVSGLERW